MRVLFSCLPGYGHFHPMIPLAEAMRDAGHQVAFATAERFCRNVVEPAGFGAYPAGLSPLAVQDRLARQAFPPGPPDEGARQARFGAAMFADVAAPAKAADLVAVLDGWRPSLVVHDPVDFGAPLAAARAGLPYAAHSFGALQRVEFWKLAAASLRSRWPWPDGHGWGSGPMLRHLYLDVCPPSLQAPHIGEVTAARPIRHVPYDTTDAAALPGWVGRLGTAPIVYVTLGTVFNHTPGLFETILSALGGEDVTIVLAVGPDRDPAELGPQPANVRIEHYLPHSLLFRHCHVVVAHGGSGTMLGALAHGLPALVLPQGADQLDNARRLAATGAGIALLPGAVTEGAVRARVRKLLSEPGYRAAAGRLRLEVQRMPDLEHAVALLEELAGLRGVGSGYARKGPRRGIGAGQAPVPGSA